MNFFNKARAKAAFETAQRIKEHQDLYCLSPDRIPVSIDDLNYVVSDMYGLKIDLLDVAFQADFIRGMVERFAEGRVRISVRRSQDKDWKRFVAAKELCQIAIGEEETWSAEGTNTLEAMVLEGALGSEGESNGSTDPEVESEYLAEFAAFEILYPAEFRPQDMKSLAEGSETQTSLSVHYDIPTYVVGVVLSERYKEFREQCLS
jgi:hypothetical protein